MAALPWILVLGLFTTVWATVPVSAAERCPAEWVNLPDVDVRTNPDCTVDVVLFEDIACLWNTQSKTVKAGPARLTYYYCTGPDPTATSSACHENGFESALLGGGVFLHGDCTVDVVLFRNIRCVGAWIGQFHETVGPVELVVYYCKYGNDPT